jgi:RNA polymerase sigma-70 factor (ECF subfamily)
VRGRVDTDDAATEIVCEAFAQLVASAPRMRRADADAPRALLYGVAENLARRYWRTQRIETTARQRLGMRTELVQSDESERVHERLDARERVAALSGALSADQRVAVSMRIIDEQPYAEIAVAVGASEARVRARVSRALRKLGRSER